MQQFSFQNKSGATYPAFACGRLNAILSTSPGSSQPIYELVKPDGEEGVYVVNGPNAVAADAYGVATSITDATLVLLDDGSTTDAPTFGQTCGPTNARWAATVTGTGLTACGALTNKIMQVTPIPSSGAAGSAGSCPCACIEDGDIVVGGIITSSVWTVPMPATRFVQTNGTITFPAGTYTLTYDSGTGTWTLDIGAFLTATYNDGSSATSATTMDGTLTMTWAGAEAEIKLCVDGTVPAPPPP